MLLQRLQDFNPASPHPTVAIAATTVTGVLAAWGAPAARAAFLAAGVVPHLEIGLTKPELIPVRRGAAAYALEGLWDGSEASEPAGDALLGEAGRAALLSLLRVG